MRAGGLFLTLGEPTAGEAYRALEAQPGLAEIVVVDGVRPFGAAFNEGVGRLSTPLFLQCDADMILYPHCLERLSASLGEGDALAMGLLDDLLQGAVRGIKLFRTELCRRYPVGETPDCETRQVELLTRDGWTVRHLTDVLGLHRPDVEDPVLIFERFRLLGVKVRLRQAWWDLTYRLGQLAERSQVPTAPLAAVALLAGLFHDAAALRGELGHPPPAGPAARDPFEAGWEAGCRRPDEVLRESVRRLAEPTPASWLFFAGFVAAVTDPLHRTAAELGPLVHPWRAHLDRKLLAP